MITKNEEYWGLDKELFIAEETANVDSGTECISGDECG